MRIWPALKGDLRLVACAGLLALMVSACQTVRSDQDAANRGIADGGSAEVVTALDIFDARLLALRLSPDAPALAALRAEMGRAAAQPGLARRLLARLDAQRAEAAFLAADVSGARAYLAAAASLSEAEEGVWVVRALMEPDPQKRLALLDQGVERAETRSRLLCERGEALLAAGRYAEAAQDLDEGLRALAPGYNALYGADRERAFALAQASRDTGNAPLRPQDLEAQLTVRAMIERTALDTPLLSGLTAEPRPSFSALLTSVRGAGLLLDPSAAPEAPASRKAVAWFLWALVARVEHDPKLLTKYRSKYVQSPVPDVAATDPWFDAVLGTVEQEIMDLPDGVHFMPEDPVTGFELVAMLARVQRLIP